MQETQLTSNTHSIVHFSSFFKNNEIVFSNKIKESVKLLKSNDEEKYVLKVVSDMGHDTEFFDLLQNLKNIGVKPNIDYCNREALEKISNMFPERDKSVKVEEVGLQMDVVAIFRRAVLKGASDIHFRIESKNAYIYFRIDGKKVFDSDYTAEHGKRLANTLFNSMCEDQSETSLSFSMPCDAKMKGEFVDQLGLSTGRFASRPGGNDRLIAIVRLIKRRTERVMFNQLGLTEHEASAIMRALNRPSGIIFSSGPTGHGKSTLSQCMAEIVHANDSGVNIITVEDPIESPIEGAFQTPLIIADKSDREVLIKAWAKAITNIMRLDPDWIYIGEVRDSTSAMGAVEAANTGHNVITTVHTQYPIDIISRLRNWDVDFDLLTDPSIITCLIGLRLVPLLCNNCKVPYSSNKDKVSGVFSETIEKHTKFHQVNLRNSAGCSECRNTGIKGRTGVFEVIETNRDFMNIYQQSGKMAAYEYWYKNGGITLCDNVIRLVNDGRIDPVYSHKDICNLDRNSLMFSEEVILEVQEKRRVLYGDE